MALRLSLDSQDIVYHGGPAPSGESQTSRVEVVEAERPGDVRILPAYEDPVSKNKIIRVVCAAIGEQRLQLRVGNTATASNPKPVHESIAIQYSCMHPVAASYWISEDAPSEERKVSCEHL